MQIVIAFVVFCLDQGTKAIFRDTAVLNSGIGFGIGQSTSSLVAPLIVLAVVSAVQLYRNTPSKRSALTHWAWPLIFGGCVSNVVDRLRLGAVIDPFRLPIIGIHCNLADVAIVVGFVVLFVASVQLGVRKR
ncbi:MAG: signal peptidase II [Patescibacteria group bacterium]